MASISNLTPDPNEIPTPRRRRTDRSFNILCSILLIAVLVLIAVALIFPKPAGAAGYGRTPIPTHTTRRATSTPAPHKAIRPRPTPIPCVEGRIETIVEGMTRQCLNGRWVAGPVATALPSNTMTRP